MNETWVPVFAWVLMFEGVTANPSFFEALISNEHFCSLALRVLMVIERRIYLLRILCFIAVLLADSYSGHVDYYPNRRHFTLPASVEPACNFLGEQEYILISRRMLQIYENDHKIAS